MRQVRHQLLTPGNHMCRLGHWSVLHARLPPKYMHIRIHEHRYILEHLTYAQVHRCMYAKTMDGHIEMPRIPLDTSVMHTWMNTYAYTNTYKHAHIQIPTNMHTYKYKYRYNIFINLQAQQVQTDASTRVTSQPYIISKLCPFPVLWAVNNSLQSGPEIHAYKSYMQWTWMRTELNA